MEFHAKYIKTMQLQSQNVALGTNLGTQNKHDYLKTIRKPCEIGI